jgi:hypothetical protein
MRSVRLIKFSSFLILAFSIAACGGGGSNSDANSGGGNNTPQNAAPTANAGEDQAVDEQTTVTLSGAGTDTDGSIASYSWSQTSGTSATLSNASSANASFTAPDISADETLSFRLTVTDNDGASSTDTINISVKSLNLVNQVPTANAGTDQTVDEQTTVTLSGTGTDADGSIASFAWTQANGITVTLQNSDTAVASFQALDVSSEEILTFDLTVTDDDGAIATDAVSIIIMPSTMNLSDISFKYNDNPEQNQEVTITLLTELELEEVEWIVVTQPESANLRLQKSSDNKSVSFTASEPGLYKLGVQNGSNDSQITTSFIINSIFPFDESKVTGNNSSNSIDELIGVIKNQSWVNSSSFSEFELRAVVDKYTSFTVIGYDFIFGLLIEYDDTNLAVKEDLEELKFESGISSVHNRLFEGKSASRLTLTPNDGSDFDDAGDNWHLEEIEVTKAWDITTGSSDILIGILDGGFDDSHIELEDRIASNQSKITSDFSRNHGNSTAGAIGAKTNNKQGMSGINWKSRMLLIPDLSESTLAAMLFEERVVVVNNSWVMAGWIPAEFDPSNKTSRNDRFKKAFDDTRSYRKDLAKKHPNKLLVWAAGNGIGNGACNTTGIYGVDARYGNSAIHLNDDKRVDRVTNVVIVAAMRDDKRLANYSNFGFLVDIAAPTSYKSLQINGGYTIEDDPYGKTGGYGGTSAAAPVVTGVASLIYSLYSGFTGEEVKDILIESATEYVTERYVTKGLSCFQISKIESLLHRIPILNAGQALALTQKIIDSKVTIDYSIPNPFMPVASIAFNSIDDELEIVGIEWELQSTKDSGVTWDFVTEMTLSGDTAEVAVDTSTPYQRIDAKITLRNSDNGSQTTANKIYEFSYATRDILAKDMVSLNPLPNVEVRIRSSIGLPISNSALTDNNGVISTFLKRGTFSIRGSLFAYLEGVTSITVNRQNPLKIDLDALLYGQTVELYMAPVAAGPIGSLRGQVVDANGHAIADATIRVSGGTKTNGFYTSTNTDENGNYNLSNIAKIDANGVPINTFILEVSAAGYGTIQRESVIVLSGKTRIENFALIEQKSTTIPEVVINGSISTVGEIDEYEFELIAGESAHFRITDINASSSFTLDAWLYNPDGTLHKKYYNGTTIEIDCGASNSDCNLLQTGTYRLVIADNGSTQTGDYEIHYARVTETNENGALINDGVVSGDITLGDLDSFVFDATAGESLHIRISDTSGGGNFALDAWLYNPDGTLHKKYYNGTTIEIDCYTGSSSCELAQTGTYRLVIADDGSVQTGDYEIEYNGPPQQPIPGLVFKWPLKPTNVVPTITQDHSCGSCYLNGEHHTGLDLVHSSADDGVYAANSGTIDTIVSHCTNGDTTCNSGFGNMVIINHVGSGKFSLYAHLNPGSITKVVDTNVVTGEKIGEVGETGNVSGPHLHLEFSNHSGLGEFGYSVTHPVNYGYLDPWAHISDVNINPTAIEVLNGTVINVRRGPSIDYDLFTEINENQQFVAFAKVTQTDGNTWYRIHLPCEDALVSCAGWVAGYYEGDTYSRITDDATIAKVVNTGVEGLQVRIAPDNSVIDKVYDGQSYVIQGSDSPGSGCESNWYKIDLPLSSTYTAGWICGDNVQLSPNAP